MSQAVEKYNQSGDFDGDCEYVSWFHSASDLVSRPELSHARPVMSTANAELRRPPAPVQNAVLDGPIQCGPVSAGLTAADELKSSAVHAAPMLAAEDDRIHSTCEGWHASSAPLRWYHLCHNPFVDIFVMLAKGTGPSIVPPPDLKSHTSAA
jgi:hypothetical protein